MSSIGKYNCSLSPLIVVLNFSYGLAIGVPPSSIDNSDISQFSPGKHCINIQDEMVRLKNGIAINFRISSPTKAEITILSVSPSGGNFLIGKVTKKQNGIDLGDIYHCDQSGNITSKLISETFMTPSEGWSKSERFILIESGIIDIKMQKFYPRNEFCSLFSANYIWSRVDDSLIYSDVDGSRNIYNRAKLSEIGLTTSEESLAGVAAILGPAFETLERRSGLMASRSYNTTKDLLISPDGQRLIFQGLRFQRYDWTISGEDVCVTLLMGKDHLLQKTRTNPMRKIECIRWLDNRYVIGRLEANGDDTPPEDRPLMLWDTKTGMVWKAPYPLCKPEDHLQFLNVTTPSPIHDK